KRATRCSRHSNAPACASATGASLPGAGARLEPLAHDHVVLELVPAPLQAHLAALASLDDEPLRLVERDRGGVARPHVQADLEDADLAAPVVRPSQQAPPHAAAALRAARGPEAAGASPTK